MALSGQGLFSIMKQSVEASTGQVVTDSRAMQAMCDSIIVYITTNGLVNTNVTTVVSGMSPSGPITGSGTGTGIGTLS